MKPSISCVFTVFLITCAIAISILLIAADNLENGLEEIKHELKMRRHAQKFKDAWNYIKHETTDFKFDKMDGQYLSAYSSLLSLVEDQKELTDNHKEFLQLIVETECMSLDGRDDQKECLRRVFKAFKIKNPEHLLELFLFAYDSAPMPTFSEDLSLKEKLEIKKVFLAARVWEAKENGVMATMVRQEEGHLYMWENMVKEFDKFGLLKSSSDVFYEAIQERRKETLAFYQALLFRLRQAGFYEVEEILKRKAEHMINKKGKEEEEESKNGICLAGEKDEL